MPAQIDLRSDDYWSIDSSFTSVVKGDWNGKKEGHEVFILSTPEILTVMRYVWQGCYLPVNQDDYAKRFDIKLSDIPDLVPQVQAKNTDFRDQIWHAIVNLSGQIYNYANTAGGKSVDGSYYGGLMQSITDFNTAKKKCPPDTATMDEMKGAITDFTDELLKSTTKLQEDSKRLQGEVSQFKDATYLQWACLNAKLDDIKRRLDQDEVKHLESTIKDLQTTSRNQRLEYDNGVVSAASTPTYALCALFGVIPADPVSKYGPRMSAIRNVIQATEDEISTEDKKLKSARVVSTDAQKITGDADAVLEHIQSAVDYFVDLAVGWERIHASFQKLHDLAGQ